MASQASGLRIIANLIIPVLWGVNAWAQADLRQITQPIAVVNTGGHSAPVRSLLFTPDGSTVLTGGLDKVVNTWNVGAPQAHLERTIRPRIWRGYAGAVHCMALSPVASANGQRYLAVAGIGVQSNRGEINLFRYPGPVNSPTGVLEMQLEGGAPRGHSMSIMDLEFDPKGVFLATASNDGTVRIWNLRTRQTDSLLSGHRGPVNALGYLPSGTRLVTGGADGTLNVWDLARKAIVASARPDPRRQKPGDPAADAINALVVSPRGDWVVIGRENGDLIRYDAATLANPTLLPPGANGQGAVLALAVNQAGTRLVSSVLTNRLAQPSDRPRLGCDVELRTMPQGAVQSRLARTSNLVQACAFSPDGGRVAYAGGDQQGLYVRELAAAAETTLELAGQGSSIWDVGFAADGRSVGFSRTRTDLGGPAPQYEDFDLSGQRVAPFNQADLIRARLTLNGWTVRPIDPYTLDLLNPQRQGYRIKLDPNMDRRWWSYTFVAGNPSHPSPTLAIGAEVGVIFYRLEDGRRTRIYAGHNGPVYTLAASQDGTWLATGSSDQTVRFWKLAGCDRLAPLGADFGAGPGGQTQVTRIEPRGFAEAMDMRVGDVVQEFYVAGKKGTNNAALRNAAQSPLAQVLPNIRIEFVVLRAGKRVELITTKRDSPALSLFPALDREWVIWTPRGYYDTSAIGDRKYLGWHRNRIDATASTDYFSFDHFEKELRKPEELGRLLQTADLNVFDVIPAGERTPDRVVAEDRLPRLEVTNPARTGFGSVVAAAPTVPIRIKATTEDEVAGRGLIRSVRVRVDSGKAAELTFNPPVASVDREVTVNVNPGVHKVSVTAVNDLDKERTEHFDVQGPEPAKPVEQLPPRLVVLAFGANMPVGGDVRLPEIPFASEDAREVGEFLAAPGGTSRFPRVEVRKLLGKEATASRITAELKRLDEERERGELGRGDSVFVMIDSHFLVTASDKEPILLAADSTPDSLNNSENAVVVPTSLISGTLGQLADYGVTVMVLLDTLHDQGPALAKNQRGLIEWSRDLYKRNVIAFLSSIHGPGLSVASRGHGAFALGVLDSLNVQGQARLTSASNRPFTLHDFQDRVNRNVQAVTSRKQHARCYIPEAITSQTVIFDPPSLSQPRQIKVAGD